MASLFPVIGWIAAFAVLRARYALSGNLRFPTNERAGFA